MPWQRFRPRRPPPHGPAESRSRPAPFAFPPVPLPARVVTTVHHRLLGPRRSCTVSHNDARNPESVTWRYGNQQVTCTNERGCYRIQTDPRFALPAKCRWAAADASPRRRSICISPRAQARFPCGALSMLAPAVRCARCYIPAPSLRERSEKAVAMPLVALASLQARRLFSPEARPFRGAERIPHDRTELRFVKAFSIYLPGRWRLGASLDARAPWGERSGRRWISPFYRRRRVAHAARVFAALRSRSALGLRPRENARTTAHGAAKAAGRAGARRRTVPAQARAPA
jgi:hypothetical protein